VLVRTCLEKYVIAVLSLKTGDAVRQHNLIAIADMGSAGGIGNRRCNIIFSLIHNTLPFPIPSIDKVYRKGA